MPYEKGSELAAPCISFTHKIPRLSMQKWRKTYFYLSRDIKSVSQFYGLTYLLTSWP
jgi:hypothetical protein